MLTVLWCGRCGADCVVLVCVAEAGDGGESAVQ